MKNVIWILFNCTILLNLITTSNSNKNEDNLNVYLKPFNSSIQETSNVSTEIPSIFCFLNYVKYLF